MRDGDRDEDYGLTPREWLDSDPVPLTPDVDLTDPEQRIAWIRANNEEMYERGQDLARRRVGGGVGSAGGDERGRDGESARNGDGAPGGGAARSATTVVAVRLLNAERRALVRLARREQVTVSDLVRRWVRAGLERADEVDPEPDAADERELTRQAVRGAADAAVERITDELRRLREIVTAAG